MAQIEEVQLGPVTKEQMLIAAVEHREAEVMQYQVNIDNFTRALGIIDTDYAGDDEVARHMRETFRPELEQRIIDEKIQQARSDVIRKACVAEVEEILRQRK